MLCHDAIGRHRVNGTGTQWPIDVGLFDMICLFDHGSAGVVLFFTITDSDLP